MTERGRGGSAANLPGLRTVKKERIWIGVPSYGGQLTCALAQTLTEAVELNHDPDHPAEYFPFVLRGFRPVEYARNLIARAFLKDKHGSRLWFVDDDMAPPRNWWTLIRHKADAVSGVAFGWNSRKWDGTGDRAPQILSVMYNADRLGKLSTVGEVRPEPFEVDAVGAACVLIRRRVFELVTEPWFVTHYAPDGDILLGEDGHFFTEANKHGIRVLIDPYVRFGHEKVIDTLDVAEYGANCRRLGYEEGLRDAGDSLARRQAGAA